MAQLSPDSTDDNYKLQTIRNWIKANVPQDEFQQRLNKTKSTLRSTHPNLPNQTLDQIAFGAAASHYTSRVPLMSFEDFSQDTTAQKKASASLTAPKPAGDLHIAASSPHRDP